MRRRSLLDLTLPRRSRVPADNREALCGGEPRCLIREPPAEEADCVMQSQAMTPLLCDALLLHCYCISCDQMGQVKSMPLFWLIVSPPSLRDAKI